jgi:hypothetical protein
MSILKSVLSNRIQDTGYSFKILHKVVSERGKEKWAAFRDWACNFVIWRWLSQLVSLARTTAQFVDGGVG